MRLSSSGLKSLASSVTLSLSARQFAFGAAVPALLASAVALAPAVQAKQSPKAAAKAAAAEIGRAHV